MASETAKFKVGENVVCQRFGDSWSATITEVQDEGWYQVRLATGGLVLFRESEMQSFNGAKFMVVKLR